MNIKKVLAMLACVSMLGALVACGDDSSSAADSSSATESSEESSEASEEESSEEESSEEESSEESSEDAADESSETASAEPEDLGPIDDNAITFDTPSLYGAHAAGGGGDEADVELEVVNLNGDNKLRVHVLRDDPETDYGVPKIVFDLPALVGVENVGNIGHISVDFTCVAREEWVNEDGSSSLVVGNFLGALAGNIASEKGYDDDGNLTQNDWATHLEFAYDDWENPTHSWRCETDIPALLPTNGYAANDEGTTLFIMRWGQSNEVDFYIDNLTFYDKDGNSMEIVYDAEGNTVDVVEDNGVDDNGSTAAPTEDADEADEAEDADAEAEETTEDAE